MLILGLSGSFNTVEDQMVPGLPRGFFHDSAAVLVEDGRVVCAVEEERVTRVKHTHTFPLAAIRRCLDEFGARLSDVDEVAFFFEEGFLDAGLSGFALADPAVPSVCARDRIHNLLGGEVPREHISFVSHHIAHAASAYYESGFEDALVLVMDGSGETESVSLYEARAGRMDLVRQIPESSSLGQLYFHGTRFLGFQLFDEYKVMGLASYGDPERFRKRFRSLYELNPDGSYSFDYREMDRALLAAGVEPRRRGAPVLEEHKHFAAALQEALEIIVDHMVDSAVRQSRDRHLCLAGGVAQNCVLNGRLAASGRFDRIFVHPASHDAGAALGAALQRASGRQPGPGQRLRTTGLGTSIGSDDRIRALLDAWAGQIEYEYCDDVAGAAAALIADGEVVGWAQGRAEFGPRALGHRSILADPRPEENRTRINAAVKKRESFRPFAPAVLAEYAAEYFELPDTEIDAEFMTFTLPVRQRHRALLAATTHVDGTARLQVVHREDDELFWRLIDSFRRLSGTPVVLNTSFNNDAEPIVDTAADALRCLLTTTVDTLAVGSFLVRRATGPAPRPLRPLLVPTSAARARPDGAGGFVYEVFESAQPFDRRRVRAVSAAAFAVLTGAAVSPCGDGELTAELARLWADRHLDMLP